MLLRRNATDFLECGTLYIEDGSQTRFTENNWAGSMSLK
jgi:hypothetical protein